MNKIVPRMLAILGVSALLLQSAITLRVNWLTTLTTYHQTQIQTFGGGSLLVVTTLDSNPFGPGTFVKISPSDGSFTSFDFPSDGLHDSPTDIVWDNSRSRAYVNFGLAARIVVSEVNIGTMAFTDVINDTNFKLTTSITTDGSNTYVTARTPLKVLKYNSSFSFISSVTPTDLSGAIIRYDSASSKIFMTTNGSAGAAGWIWRIDPSMTIEDSAQFQSGDNSPADDFAFTPGFVWVGLEASTGIGNVLQISKTTLSSINRVVTGVGVAAFAVYFDGTRVLASYNNTPGTLIAIEPTSRAFVTMQYPGSMSLSAPNELNSDGSSLYTGFFLSPPLITQTPLSDVDCPTTSNRPSGCVIGHGQMKGHINLK